MSNDCLFCKIIKGEIPSTKVYEDESVYGFVDLYPMAKVHYLFINKNHSADISEMSKNSPEDIICTIKALTAFADQDQKLKSGYRIVTNKGPDGCQSVFHTHFHLLGGEKLKGFGA